MNKFLLYILTLSCIIPLSGCLKQTETHTLHGNTMGTNYTVRYRHGGKLPDETAVQAGLERVLEEVNRQMSTYREDSEITHFNRMSAAEGSFPISPDFAEVVAEALRINRISNGALDVTIGPLVNLWGFGPEKSTHTEPTQAQIRAILPAVGVDKLQLNRATTPPTLAKTNDKVYLDLSSIAKGFGVDRVAAYLDSLGIGHYMVEIGGEVRTKGQNAAGQAWRIGIEQPQTSQTGTGMIVVGLDNLALATSGDYRNFRTDSQGRRLSHIIHPSTRQPIGHNLASVSVIADTAMTADALSTALFVLGEEQGMELAERDNLAVFMIIRTPDGFVGKMSPAFQNILERKTS